MHNNNKMTISQLSYVLLRQLPQVLQDLVGMFNAEHRPQMKTVMSELVQKSNYWNEHYKCCNNCGNRMCEENEDLENEYYIISYIIFKKYTFCSEYCMYNGEDDIRKNWTKLNRLKK